MKYFIGYHIEGAAAAWMRNLQQEISDRFGTWKLHERVAPHITLFRPFEIEAIDEVKTFLKNWTEQHSIPGNFSMSGFDHFQNTVVFAKTEAEAPITALVAELVKSLRAKIPALPEPEFSLWHPHATLAYRLPPEKIEEIWSYVNTLTSEHFTLPFAALTLFRFDGSQKWLVEESHVFRSKGKSLF